MLKQAIPCDKDQYAIESLPAEEKTLVQDLLTNKESLWNTHCADISKLLAQSILHNHPIVPNLLRQINLPPGTLQDYTDEVRSVCFNKDGDKIVTILKDHTAKIWDVKTESCLTTLEGHTNTVHLAQFNKAGDKVVTTSWDNTAKIWDASTGTCLATLEGHTDTVYSAQFNKDGDKILTTSQDKTAKIWDANNGTCLTTIRNIGSAQFNRTGDKIVTTSSWGHTAKIWDANNGTCLATLEGHTGHVSSAQFNKAGDKVVTTSWDNTAKIWDASTGVCLATLEGHTDKVYSAQFNKDGDKILTISWNKDARMWGDVNTGTCKIWNVNTGTCLTTLEDPTHGISSGQFNKAGDKVLTTSNNIVKIWDIRVLDEIPHFLSKQITLQQAFILNAIYEVMIARTLVKKYGKEDKSFLESITTWVPLINSYLLGKMCFDFNTYPHLQQHYESLPQEIQNKFDKYITKKTDSFEVDTYPRYPRYVLLALCTAAALWAAKKTLFDKPAPTEQTNEAIDKTREETV